MTIYSVGSTSYPFFFFLKFTNSLSRLQMRRLTLMEVKELVQGTQDVRDQDRTEFTFFPSQDCVHSSIHRRFSNDIIDFTVVFSLFLLKQYQ